MGMPFIVERREVRRIVFEEFDARQIQSRYIFSDTEVWSEIFSRVFGETPRNDEDPRWDRLLLGQARGGRFNAFRLARLYTRLSKRRQP